MPRVRHIATNCAHVEIGPAQNVRRASRAAGDRRRRARPDFLSDYRRNEIEQIASTGSGCAPAIATLHRRSNSSLLAGRDLRRSRRASIGSDLPRQRRRRRGSRFAARPNSARRSRSAPAARRRRSASGWRFRCLRAGSSRSGLRSEAADHDAAPAIARTPREIVRLLGSSQNAPAAVVKDRRRRTLPRAASTPLGRRARRERNDFAHRTSSLRHAKQMPAPGSIRTSARIATQSLS